MELSNKAIQELISLKDEYEKLEKLADKKFMERALDIIESEERFNNLLEYEFGEFSYLGPCYAEDNKIFVDEKKLIEFSKRNTHLFRGVFFDNEMFAIRNINVLYCLLHEPSHVWQFCALDDYDEINRLYAEISKKSVTLYNKIMYNILRSNYSLERHANIDAYRELGRIYEETIFAKIPSIFHMYYLDALYGRLSPVDKTLFIMHIKNDFNTEGIPNSKLIDVGFRLDKDILRELKEIVIKEARGYIDYKESLRLINKL